MADDADIANDRMQQAIDDALAARRLHTVAESADDCIDCGLEIPSARQIAAPGCQRCAPCQDLAERKAREYRR